MQPNLTTAAKVHDFLHITNARERYEHFSDWLRATAPADSEAREAFRLACQTFVGETEVTVSSGFHTADGVTELMRFGDEEGAQSALALFYAWMSMGPIPAARAAFVTYATPHRDDHSFISEMIAFCEFMLAQK